MNIDHRGSVLGLDHLRVQAGLGVQEEDPVVDPGGVQHGHDPVLARARVRQVRRGVAHAAQEAVADVVAGASQIDR